MVVWWSAQSLYSNEILVWTSAGAFLFAVCMFFLFLCGISLVTLGSSHCPKTCMLGLLDVSVSIHGCMSLCQRHGLVTCLKLTLHLTLCQLGIDQPPNKMTWVWKINEWKLSVTPFTQICNVLYLTFRTPLFVLYFIRAPWFHSIHYYVINFRWYTE